MILRSKEMFVITSTGNAAEDLRGVMERLRSGAFYSQAELLANLENVVELLDAETA